MSRGRCSETRRRQPYMRNKLVVSTERPVAKPTADGVLVLIPWRHPLADDVEDACGECPRCSQCSLKAGWNVLGFGVDGSVCYDCAVENCKAIQKRLREYRAA
jgi:hypothetical protein